MPALQYPQGYPATASNFFKQISIRYWSTKSWILLGGSFSPSFWRLAKKKSSMMSSSNFIDPLAIFYHSPNLLVQNPGFNPNVKSPFRQCWLDYHNGNDLISPWYIEKSPCTTYCIFISGKKKRKLGDVLPKSPNTSSSASKDQNRQASKSWTKPLKSKRICGHWKVGLQSLKPT